MTGADEWASQVRRIQAARRAARRRHPASGGPEPDCQPPTPTEETSMPANTDPPDADPEWWRAVHAAQQARHRTIDELIAYADAHRPERITPLEIAARAFEQPPGEAQDDDQ